MRLYSATGEEALRARRLLKDWAGEGFLTEAQYQRMEKETVCEFRLTNIFMRLVLFLFAVILVTSAVGLFFVAFLRQPGAQTTGTFLLVFAAISYGAAEFTASQGGLYRYGIEEALAVCSVGFLCVGMKSAFFSGSGLLPKPDGAEFVVPAAGAIASLWIWRRFGLSYAFLAAMIFMAFLPDYWTSSHAAQRVMLALLYAAGLAAVAAVRARHRFDYLNDGYSLVEAFLWLGIYFVMNLQLSSLRSQGLVWSGVQAATEFPKPFYWATWVLIWLLPAAALVRGLRARDRFVIAAGGSAAILTFVTNKPYLGWPRHTWDPMLLGILLTGVALFVRRWLANGPDGIRHGFTGERLSGKHKEWMNAGSTALGLLSPHSITPAPQTGTPGVRFGGGDSAGGGATGDF